MRGRFLGRRALSTLTVATTVVVASILAPAFGAPAEVSAVSIAKRATKALKLAKRANRNAKRALAQSGEPGTAGAQGPAGAQGSAGPQGPAGEKGDKGDTGAQGPAGATGDTGAQGPAGAKGDKGDTGAQGPAGIVTTGAFGGVIGTVTTTGNWQFAGGTVLVNVQGQRLTGAGRLPIAVQSGNATVSVEIDLCYQSTNPATPEVRAMNLVDYALVHVSSTRVSHAVTGTVVPSTPGGYRVGACLRAPNGTLLNANDYASGWVQVTN